MVDYSRSGLHHDTERISQWAVTVKDDEGFVIDLVDRPPPGEIRRLQKTQGRVGVSMNLWKFSYNHILPFLESVPLHPVRQEKELNAAVKMMVLQRPRSLYAIPLSEHVVDLTSKADIPVVEEYVRKEFPNL